MFCQYMMYQGFEKDFYITGDFWQQTGKIKELTGNSMMELAFDFCLQEKN